MRIKEKELILGMVCKGEVVIHYFWPSLVTANSITAWHQKTFLFFASICSLSFLWGEVRGS